MPDRVAVIGARGMLGQDLCLELSNEGFDVVALGHEDIEITGRDETIAKIKELKPLYVVNVAAYTRVDDAEKHREQAYRVNGLGVQNLALACSESKALLCHVSTDYVFSGNSNQPYTPFDTTSPINFYGLSKLSGEQFIRDMLERFYIVRTSWLYAHHGRNFVRTILRLASERDTLKVVDDQIGSPTWTVTLSKGIIRIIRSGAFGIHHVTDRTEGGISWYRFACEIIKLKGLKTEVKPISTSEYPTPAKRPRYSVLDLFFTEVSTGFKAPHWIDSLRECLKRI
ncbi:MAG: dTDP-4-dehydrorhamnose reductase [Nitrospirae bacterium]|nr:dTDP-4-dehydrorhamnose reductase [Nitrospirota bacterium]